MIVSAGFQFLRQPLSEVTPEDGDLLMAGIIDTFPMIGHWRQPFCHRQTPAHFPP